MWAPARRRRRLGPGRRGVQWLPIRPDGADGNPGASALREAGPAAGRRRASAPVLLTGRDTNGQRREKLAALASGQAQVAIGTHALFQDAVRFDRLALAVIDEQHRFGVSERQRLQAKGDPRLGAVHLLTMSATPIPRTLELTQYGELEVSRLMEKPPGRTPVTTAVLPLARIGEVAARLKTAVESGAQA